MFKVLPEFQKLLEIDTRPKPLRNRIENAKFWTLSGHLKGGALLSNTLRGF